MKSVSDTACRNALSDEARTGGENHGQVREHNPVADRKEELQRDALEPLHDERRATSDGNGP